VSRKKTGSQSKGESSARKLKLSIQICEEEKGPDGWEDLTGSNYPETTVRYRVSINDFQPVGIEVIGRTTAKAKNSAAYRKTLLARWNYVRDNMEEAVTQAIFQLVNESEIACTPGVDIDQEVAGLAEFERKTLSDLNNPNIKDLETQLALMAFDMHFRVKGHIRGLSSLNKEIRLNPWQLRNLGTFYYGALNDCREVREAYRQRREAKIRWSLPDDLIQALQNRTNEKGYKWRVQQVAIVAAARRAGVKNIGMENHRTLTRLLKSFQSGDK
jgi:hypothetical protein